MGQMELRRKTALRFEFYSGSNTQITIPDFALAIPFPTVMMAALLCSHILPTSRNR
jgi:hypothetical protein